MIYEESKLFSLLKKQDIDSLFLEATNYLCQTKSLFEEKEQLQQENEQLREVIDKINHILNNQINYREFVDIVNDIEDVLKEVQE